MSFCTEMKSSIKQQRYSVNFDETSFEEVFNSVCEKANMIMKSEMIGKLF